MDTRLNVNDMHCTIIDFNPPRRRKKEEKEEEEEKNNDYDVVDEGEEE